MKFVLHHAGGLCGTGYKDDHTKINWNINYLLGHAFPSMHDLLAVMWDLITS